MSNPAWATWPAHPAEAGGVHPTMAPFLASIAPAGSVHADAQEAQRIEADLKRNEDKNSGKLLRDEIDAAHRREVAEGAHQ